MTGEGADGEDVDALYVDGTSDNLCLYTRILGLLKAKHLCPWRWFRLVAKYIPQSRSMECSVSDGTLRKQP